MKMLQINKLNQLVNENPDYLIRLILNHEMNSILFMTNKELTEVLKLDKIVKRKEMERLLLAERINFWNESLINDKDEFLKQIISVIDLFENKNEFPLEETIH